MQTEFKVFGGVLLIALLLIAGIYSYSKWSYKSFVSEFEESPQSDIPSESISENDTTTPSENSKPILSTKPDTKNLDIDSQPLDESDPITSSDEKEVSAEKIETSEPSSDFDATPLLSAFGIPDEVASLLGEDAEDADFEQAQAQLTEKYGQSPEVEAIIDKLKQMSGRPVQLDEITELFEAWIQVLPEEEQQNRRQLMNALTLLHQAKAQGGGGGPVRVTVTSKLDPSLLKGDGENRVILKTTATETIDD